jgi:hypothetical protein
VQILVLPVLLHQSVLVDPVDPCYQLLRLLPYSLVDLANRAHLVDQLAPLVLLALHFLVVLLVLTHLHYRLVQLVQVDQCYLSDLLGLVFLRHLLLQWDQDCLVDPVLLVFPLHQLVLLLLMDQEHPVVPSYQLVLSIQVVLQALVDLELPAHL